MAETNVNNRTVKPKVEFKQVKCPFDLEKVFSVQFNTNGLREVLEYIFEQLGQHDELHDQMDEQFKLQEQTYTEQFQKKAEEIEDLKQLCLEIDQGCLKNSDAIELLETSIGESNNSIQAVHDQLVESQGDIQKLQEAMGKNYLIGVTMENLQQTFALRGSPDNTVQRITKLELNFSELQHKVKNAAVSVNSGTASISKEQTLKGSISQQTSQQPSIAMQPSIAAPVQPKPLSLKKKLSLNRKESSVVNPDNTGSGSSIQQLAIPVDQRLTYIESQIEIMIDTIENQDANDETDFRHLQSSESQQHLSVVQMIEQLQDEIKLKSDKKRCKHHALETRKQVEKIQVWIDNADVHHLCTLRHDFDKFKNTEFNQMKDDIDNTNKIQDDNHTYLTKCYITLKTKLVQDMQDMNEQISRNQFDASQLINKVEINIKSLQELQFHKARTINAGQGENGLAQEVEKNLMGQINEIVNTLSTKMADKIETKRSLKLMERQLKNLYDMVIGQKEHQNNKREDEAMLGKKHICGYACAFCDKDIVNLQGKQVEFTPWRSMPSRDPNDRIARVGQGFSKILGIMSSQDQHQHVLSSTGSDRTQFDSQNASQPRFIRTPRADNSDGDFMIDDRQNQQFKSGGTIENINTSSVVPLNTHGGGFFLEPEHRRLEAPSSNRNLSIGRSKFQQPHRVGSTHATRRKNKINPILMQPNSESPATVLTQSGDSRAVKRSNYKPLSSSDQYVDTTPYLAYEDFVEYRRRCWNPENNLAQDHHFFQTATKARRERFEETDNSYPIHDHMLLHSTKYMTPDTKASNPKLQQSIKPRAQTPQITDEERAKVDQIVMDCMREVGNIPRERPTTFKNLFPFAKHKAIHDQDNLGYNSFKFAKQTQPMGKLMFKKFEKCDPVSANKKFYRQNPNLSEFAKQQPMPKDPEELLNQQKNQQQNQQTTVDNEAQVVSAAKKKKSADHETNNFKMKKEFRGLNDRFAPGRAWYHNVHNAGQLGYMRNPENEAKFYKQINNKKMLKLKLTPNQPSSKQ